MLKVTSNMDIKPMFLVTLLNQECFVPSVLPPQTNKNQGYLLKGWRFIDLHERTLFRLEEHLTLAILFKLK